MDQEATTEQVWPEWLNLLYEMLAMFVSVIVERQAEIDE